MLDGEIAYREGRFDEAFAHLRHAIELDDALPYDEPWGWMQPTRHAYGALLLEQGHVEEAAEVYAADLGLDPTLARPCQHPGNVWSLHGYHECLQRLGRNAEAAIIGQQLELGRGASRCADQGIVRVPARGCRHLTLTGPVRRSPHVKVSALLTSPPLKVNTSGTRSEPGRPRRARGHIADP